MLLVSPTIAEGPFVESAQWLLWGHLNYLDQLMWNGFWEAWANRICEEYPTELHVQKNPGHSVEEIHGKVMNAVQPFYADVQTDPSWSCKAEHSDCEPEIVSALSQGRLRQLCNAGLVLTRITLQWRSRSVLAAIPGKMQWTCTTTSLIPASQCPTFI